MFWLSERRCSAKLVVDMAPPLSKWRAARRSSRSRASTWRSAYAPLPSKRACGVVELAAKDESRAVGMRVATIKGACGTAELAVEGESMAVDMRAATIKGACGAAELCQR